MPEGSTAVAFLGAAGFQAVRRLLLFETDLQAFAADAAALLRWMAPRVPAGAAAVPLAEAPHGQVVQLMAPQFHLLPHDVEGRLRPGARNAYDPLLSTVVVRDEEAGAALLCCRHGPSDDQVLEIDLRAVAPSWRGRWANLMLMERTARLGRAAGIRRFRFQCEPGNQDTIALARRTGAASLPPLLVMSLPLGAEPRILRKPSMSSQPASMRACQPSAIASLPCGVAIHDCPGPDCCPCGPGVPRRQAPCNNRRTRSKHMTAGIRPAPYEKPPCGPHGGSFDQQRGIRPGTSGPGPVRPASARCQ